MPGEIPISIITPEQDIVQVPEETELNPIIEIPIQEPVVIPEPNPYVPDEKPQI